MVMAAMNMSRSSSWYIDCTVESKGGEGGWAWIRVGLGRIGKLEVGLEESE